MYAVLARDHTHNTHTQTQLGQGHTIVKRLSIYMITQICSHTSQYSTPVAEEGSFLTFNKREARRVVDRRISSPMPSSSTACTRSLSLLTLLSTNSPPPHLIILLLLLLNHPLLPPPFSPNCFSFEQTLLLPSPTTHCVHTVHILHCAYTTLCTHFISRPSSSRRAE